MQEKKKVSIMCFHDELCQVFNALMTALSLLREGAKVTIFFGSRGINAVHKERVKNLKCMPDEPKEFGEAVLKKMDDLGLPTIEDFFVMLHAEGAWILACPLNKSLFNMKDSDFVKGVAVADPGTYYKEVVIGADMNLAF